MNNEMLTLTQEWDKAFPKSDKADHRKVTFRNRYGITLAADMYTPKNAEGKLPAVAVCGPFGAVKDYHSCYKSDRGYHPRLLNSNGGWNIIGCMSFMNQPINTYSNEIRNAVLIIPDAVHTDLYDGGGKDAIPFDRIEGFYRDYLK